MKKSMLALAVLGAFASAASAQSSVTLFGIVDVNARWVDNDGPGSRKTLSTDGISASRLGVRGVEDLGGGLRAGFWLETPISADTGTTNTAKFWNRRSTISLMGGFGELRLGRDIVPSYWNTSVFEPMGAIGVGSANAIANFNATPPGPNLNAAAYPSGSTAQFVRQDNAIGYFLPPNIGGVYGQAMVGAGEGNAGRYLGARIGWAGGPVNVAAAYGRTKADAANNIDFDVANVGASFDLGPVRVMGFVARNELDLPGGLDPRETRGVIGARVRVGVGEIRAAVGYASVEERGGFIANEDARLIGLGYVHNLSKRTALYTAVAHLDNKGNSTTGGRLSISGGNTAIRPGGTSKAAEVGVSHSF